MDILRNPAFLCCVTAIIMIVVGVVMYQNETGFWDFLETELLLMIYAAVLILTILSAEEWLDDFLFGTGGEKLAAILFIPICAVSAMLGARYGGDLINRGLDALIQGIDLDLSGSFTMGHSVLGEYPTCLYWVGLAVTPTAWCALSSAVCQYRWWIFAALGAAFIGVLSSLVWLYAAALLIIAVAILFVRYVLFRWFLDEYLGE